MTRKNLIQAIYDNTDSWSCASPCPNMMEKYTSLDALIKCAENLLAEYEAQIRAEAIAEFAELIKEHIDLNGTNASRDCMRMAIFSKHYIDELSEQLKSRDSKNCTTCIIDGTDACPRGAGRAIDDEICAEYLSRDKE